MLGQGYSDKTLCDNWFEDRLAPPINDAVQKFIRPDDDVRAGRQIRFKKPPSLGTPNDGFGRYTMSKTHEDYPDPASVPENGYDDPGRPQFVSSETIAEICYEDRRPMNDVMQRGFGCIIDRHPPGVYDRDWGTAEREARHIPKDLDKYFVARTQYLKSNMPAGVPSIRQPLSKQGGLVGENPELCDIPTQRAWMNQEDPGLREYSKTSGQTPAIPEKDNELSLPLGDGAQAKIIAQLKARGGKLYRTKTCITTGKSGKDQISVWDDYPLS